MPLTRLHAGVLVLSLLALPAAGCGDDEPTTPTEPTPTRPTITQEFSGTLTVNGGRTHEFATTGSGQITVTLTELAPNSQAEIGVSLGTWNGATCQIVIARDRATQSAVVVGAAGGAGSYCVRVYDAGELTATTDYRVTVVHF
jgi:hypothetical protein